MAVLQAYQTDLLNDLDKAFCKVQVWARTTRGPSPSRSGDQRWAQKASLATHAPPPPVGRAKERHGSERGKTWGRCSGWSVLYDTFVRTRVRHLLLSLRGASALLILSNSPVTNATRQSSLLVELALLPQLEGHLWACRSLLSVWVLLYSEKCVKVSAPQSSAIGRSPVGRASLAPLTLEGHLWACRSLLSI